MENRVSEPISDSQLLDVELLGKPIHIIREKLDNLISESCSNLTTELQNWLSTGKVEASLTSVDLHRFTSVEMDKEQTSTYQHQEGGMVFIHGNPHTLIKLADRFYGASAERSAATLTASDLRLQERISRIIIGWLAPGEMWDTGEYETPRGIGINVQLNIAFDDHQGSIHLKLDGHLIQTLIEQLELQPDTDLFQPFCRSLETAPVRLNVVLSKKKMPLSDVVGLQPNDILPIELLNTVPVSIGNQSLFTGRIAEQDGQLVLIFNPDKEPQR
ncbi:FliM/FliN family flagellar motor switch protein [Vibrio alginolyticus]|uniref:FliM/FliN family flagellar motor switch protein n=1 Tax=Vibrio alginolyticus TaxID=663 RepID=UPI00215C0B4F|nr:flagellar motor switch protein FliM [Vibrio alginolyticus]EKK7178793.1 FliM/FliN family flagellar motor switch protein [Vibrio alginolyticus]MCR9337403.1 FliM/FliN family flagellar motor switch protein [Vibrio alginolyticus]MCR9340291.1 FliM/FliN family flagellar motor switch protein [Vibrio alginolyticus]MCR9393632.1 FliM/FliN family flagellar motor switch protein [Vibrio alginolyticus]